MGNDMLEIPFVYIDMARYVAALYFLLLLLGNGMGLRVL